MIKLIRLQIVIFLILVGGILSVTSWMAFAANQGNHGTVDMEREDFHSFNENIYSAEYLYSVSSSTIFSLTKSLEASDGKTDDRFGKTVATEGDTIIIGAPGDDDQGIMSGSVFIFSRNTGGVNNWGFEKKLIYSNSNDFYNFGNSVGVSGDKVVVGAFGAPGIREGTGAAYLYERDFGGVANWGLRKWLRASDGAPSDNFGIAVTIDSDTIAVGAPRKGNNIGAVYIFQRNFGGSNNWGEVEKITPSDSQIGDRFGQSVSLDGDTLIVGASGKSNGAGAAYIFERDQGGMDNWGQVTKLSAFDGESFENFGSSVTINGDIAAVGAENGDGFVDSSGVVYLFERNQGGSNQWGLIKKVAASDGMPGDFFGKSLSLAGDQLVIGASLAAGNEIGSGAVYVFMMDWGGIGNWGELAKIIHPNGKLGDGFGSAVSIQQDLIAIGATGFDAVNIRSGAAFIFEQTTADLEIVKQVNKSIVAPGDTITYTLSYANKGPKSATNLTITDTLPISQTLIKWESAPFIPQNQFSQNGQELAWQLPSLSVNNTGTITIIVSTELTVPSGVYLNTVEISGTPGDIFQANNDSKSGVLIANEIFSVFLPVIFR